MLPRLGLLSLLLAGAAHPAASAPPDFHPRLLRVRMEAGSVPAGGSLGVTCWWQNAGEVPSENEERFFVHVRRAGEAEDAPNGVRLGADHDPSVSTCRWRPGRLVIDSFAVSLPRTIPPGEYVLLLGLFDPTGGGRRTLELPTPPGENSGRYLVGRFHVLPAGEKATGTPVEQTFFAMPPASPTARLAPPAHTLTLGSGPLRLLLDAEAPRPLAWRMGGAELRADPDGDLPEVRILSTTDNRVRLADAGRYTTRWEPRRAEGRAVYHGTVQAGREECVSFDLALQVQGSRAEVALENVSETPGHQLVSVRLNRLVSAAGEGARMALPWHAGRLVDPAKSLPSERILGMDWFTQMLAGVLYDRRLLCALEVPGIDDRLVAGTGEGWAALGASLEHRAPAQAAVPSLLLSPRSGVRLQFLAPDGHAPEWADGARLLRAEVRAKLPKRYEKAVLYKIFCDSPGASSFTTFEQAADLVGRMSHLIDGAPQVAYLVGWQHRGHDTGYPDVFTINPRLGGRDGLLAAMKRAEGENALLSFHDNYDDAYQQSPSWDPEMVARDPSGALMKGGVWAGGQSYILSFGKYGAGPGLERVRRTLDMLPVRGSYHIDVLSAVPHRLDFNPKSPTSGAASVQGKSAIVREFNRRGVDVTSEGFCAPFVGVIGHAWHLMRGRDVLFAGEERIPFTPFVYHGHATWGGARASTEDIPDALLYGATFSADFGRGTPQAALTDAYYLLQTPFLLLRGREMTGYQAAGSTRRVEYGRGTSVEVDDKGPHYRVLVDGRPVSVDFTTFAPNWRGDAWLAYSRAGGPLEYPAPPGWSDAAKVRAVALTPEGPGATLPVRLENGRIRLETAPATPYRVTYER